MNLKSKTTIGLIAAGSLVVGLTVAQPAQAGSNLCPSSMVCLYEDQSYVALLGYLSGGQPLHNVSSGANDKMSSWENKSSHDGAWFDDANASGTCHNMFALSESPWVGLSSNDKLTSWRTNAHC